MQGSVVPYLKLVGYRNIKFSVDIKGTQAREIAQRWQVWFETQATVDVCKDMSDEQILAFEPTNIR
eukprot:11891307-Karenia_brevis.AAC.1